MILIYVFPPSFIYHFIPCVHLIWAHLFWISERMMACAVQTREKNWLNHFLVMLVANVACFAATNQTMKLYCRDCCAKSNNKYKIESNDSNDQGKQTSGG